MQIYETAETFHGCLAFFFVLVFFLGVRRLTLNTVRAPLQSGRQ